MSDKLNIKSGKFYRTRDGRKVGPMIANGYNRYWPWVDDHTHAYGNAWDADGMGAVCTPLPKRDPSLDLIAEWAEPTPDYNDGRWYAWAGGDFPVHRHSIIEAVYVDDNGEKMEFGGYALGKVCDSPFLFRVVEAYKEPQEAWLSDSGDFYWSHEEALRRSTFGTPRLFREVRSVAQ